MRLHYTEVERNGEKVYQFIFLGRAIIQHFPRRKICVFITDPNILEDLTVCFQRERKKAEELIRSGKVREAIISKDYVDELLEPFENPSRGKGTNVQTRDVKNLYELFR